MDTLKSVRTKALTKKQFYASAEFKDTGSKELDPKHFDFLSGFVTEGEAWAHYRVKSDGVLLLHKISSVRCIHNAPFQAAVVHPNGFMILDHQIPRTDRKWLADNEIVVTTSIV